MKKYSYPTRTIVCRECGNQHTGQFSHVQKFCSESCRHKNQNKREYVAEQKQKYLLNNPEKRKQTAIESKKRNWNNPKNLEYRKNYSQRLEIRLKNALRARVKKSLKSNPKLTTTTELVGCSIEQLKKHIEQQFQPNMNWNNWSQYGWHLDHIKPLSSANTVEEMKSLCHYTNLQPLWWTDNLSKRDKILEDTDN
jgi:hypothetical protein